MLLWTVVVGGAVLTTCRMSEKGVGESIEKLKDSMGNVVLCGDPERPDHIRYQVISFKNGKNAVDGTTFKYIKPFTCVLEMVAYLTSLFVNEFQEAPEIIMETVPGTHDFCLVSFVLA